MLSSYRVIDCTDERGQLAGFMLAQLGADVLLVEPPGGSSARRCPPFAGDRAGSDTSLWHWAYNRGKRSVVVDLTTAAGRSRLDDLVADGDVLLWTGRPSEMPFTYDDLAAVNPRLVVAVLTPFGLDGPKANWAATDLVVSAAGCASALIGRCGPSPVALGFASGVLARCGGYGRGVVGCSGRAQAIRPRSTRRRLGAGFLLPILVQLRPQSGLELADDAPLRRRSGLRQHQTAVDVPRGGRGREHYLLLR